MIFGKLKDFFGSTIFAELKKLLNDYFPPSISPKEKAELEHKLNVFLHEKELKTYEILNDAAAQLDRRIREQEGTAKDLMSLPVLGRLMIFARGAQRPIWGFSTLYFDYLWFFSNLQLTSRQEQALIIINILVLGFLFGERAIKNLEPLIIKVFAKNLDKPL